MTEHAVLAAVSRARAWRRHLEERCGQQGEPISPAYRRISIGQIIRATARHFDTPPEKLIGDSRSQESVWPRHVAMYLASELTDKSFKQIGRQFNNRDHSTVLGACRNIARAVADPKSIVLRDALLQIEDSLLGRDDANTAADISRPTQAGRA